MRNKWYHSVSVPPLRVGGVQLPFELLVALVLEQKHDFDVSVFMSVSHLFIPSVRPVKWLTISLLRQVSRLELICESADLLVGHGEPGWGFFYISLQFLQRPPLQLVIPTAPHVNRLLQTQTLIHDSGYFVYFINQCMLCRHWAWQQLRCCIKESSTCMLWEKNINKKRNQRLVKVVIVIYCKSVK